jgi:UDP-2,3-diacylglucosamine pyrophosphatase LpxH
LFYVSRELKALDRCFIGRVQNKVSTKRRKYLKKLFPLLLCLTLLLTWGCSSSPQTLTVKANIATTETAEVMPAVGPANEIILDFSEALDKKTVENMVSLYALKAGGLEEEPLAFGYDAQNPNRLIVRTGNGANLTSGEAYKLVVRRGILSTGGRTLAQDFIGYFATDYNLGYTAEPIVELDNTRTIIVVISDIHLGDRRSIDEKYGWFNNNTPKLLSFLNYLRQSPHVRELVIAGDTFDEWVAPMAADTFNGVSQSQFVDMIAAANQSVINAVNNIIAEGNIRVTYVPGNHDMLVESKDVQRVFPGITEARDARGLGACTPLDRPEIIIEHGHRYDFFNAPDPISNRSITKIASIMPPGFFVSKIAATSDQERGRSVFIRQQLSGIAAASQHYLSYWAAWQLIMLQKPVQESWKDKIIKTGIDGYTDMYAIDDLIPYHQSDNGPLDVNLYKGIVATWYERQQSNNVAVPILAEIAIAAGAFNPALDAQAIEQYFWNKSSGKRIVVFGHTHSAGLYTFINSQLRGTIYANSGTWVDNGNPTCTFAAIIPQKDQQSVTETVTVYQYEDENNIKKLKSAAITN